MATPARPSGEQRILDQVREQYTKFPYPPLEADPGFPLFAALHYVRHVFWPERSTLEGLRVLDAGCGTGHTAVQIARDFPEVEVTGIDLSASSLEVAAQRAEHAGPPVNLTFRQGTIEDLPTTEHFDYIVSSGVLHHLADPVKGATRLAKLLAPTGGAGIMVYGTFGRYAVYMLQDLMRRLAGRGGEGGPALADQAALARTVVRHLPPTHPFRAAQWDESVWGDDAGIVDLLLHVRDRSYTVPQLMDLLTLSGFRLERFYAPAAYLPEVYVDDPALAGRLAALEDDRKAEVAELLHGGMSQHLVFATLQGRRPLRFPNHGMLLMHMRPRRMRLFDWSAIAPVPPDAGADLVEVPHWAFPVPRRVVRFPAWGRSLVERADGVRTALQLFEDPAVRAGVPGASVDEKTPPYLRLLELLAREELLLFEP